MSGAFQLTTQAIDDLDDIWRFIAQYSTDAADKVETEIIATCHRLAEYPLLGHRRQDITPLPVRFWTLPKYPNVIVYRPVKPLQVITILHSKQVTQDILQDRLPEKEP